MITRRNFIATSAAAASSPVALQAAEEQHVRLPLKAMPKVRTLSVKPTRDGRLLLFSDGPESPQKLIRPKALERAFGPGTDLVLRQPDHWRMIDEGWFAEEDLYEPRIRRSRLSYMACQLPARDGSSRSSLQSLLGPDNRPHWHPPSGPRARTRRASEHTALCDRKA